jgi:5-methylthioribose kinase
VNFIDDIKEFNFTILKVIFYAFGRRSSLNMQKVLKFNDIQGEKYPHMEPSRYTVGELLLRALLKCRNIFLQHQKTKKSIALLLRA